MQRDAYYSATRSRLILRSPNSVAISVSPAQFRDQDIINPRHLVSIIKMYRSAEPLYARINGNLTKNCDSATFSSHVVGLEVVPREVSDVDTSERMNFANNPVLGETPKSVNLRLLTVNTVDKLNSAIAPATRAEC